MNSLQDFINDISAYPVLPWSKVRKRFRNFATIRAELAEVKAKLAEEEAYFEQLGIAMWIDPEPLGMIKRLHEHTLDGIRNAIVKGNLRLVINCLKKYLALNQDQEFELLSEANFGLLEAVDHFDMDRGFVFSTYACTVMNRRMQNVVNGKSMFMKRGHMQRVNLYVVARQKLIAAGDPNPSEQSIADLLNETGPKSNRGKWSEKTVSTLSISERIGQCLSINYDYGEESDRDDHGRSSLSASLAVSDEDPARQEMLGLVVDVVYNHLDERSRDIILLRINDCTLKEIGAMYGITRERVRQIEAVALDRVRKVLKFGRATRKSLDSIVERLGMSPQEALIRWLPGTRLEGSELYLEPSDETPDQTDSEPSLGYPVVDEPVEVAAVLVA